MTSWQILIIESNRIFSNYFLLQIYVLETHYFYKKLDDYYLFIQYCPFPVSILYVIKLDW